MSHSEQKVAFVTGSSRGIGYGIATQLNEEGYFVVMSGTSPIEAARMAYARVDIDAYFDAMADLGFSRQAAVDLAREAGT